MRHADGRFTGTGSWRGIDYALELVLSKSATAWFWHVQLDNRTANTLSSTSPMRRISRLLRTAPCA